MKYKFIEDPLEIPKYSGKAPNNVIDYWKEVNWIAKNAGLKVNGFVVDSVTFGGEPCLFYKDQYYGYLDNLFYEAYAENDFSMWWDFDN